MNTNTVPAGERDFPRPAIDNESKTQRLQLSQSDFGVELGADPTFVDLPRISAKNAIKRLCVTCHKHKALYRYRGRVRRDKDHDLCFRCYEATRDRLRAMSLR